MPSPLILIRPDLQDDTTQARLSSVLSRALAGIPYEAITRAESLYPLKGRLILFAVSMGAAGINVEYYAMLEWIRTHPDCLQGCIAGMIMDNPANEFYTKAASGELAFAANLAGCAFVGRPLVEGTSTLHNFDIVARNMEVDTQEAYCRAAYDLVCRIMGFSQEYHPRPNLLVLHASNRKTSNTLALWGGIRERLGDACDITEIGLRNGAVIDCSGCPYTACLHFGEQGGCFYGGVVVEDVYPAVRQANALVMISPNYNDSLSANLTAFINRLTALFRTMQFYDKALFGIIVSGYSGGDILARQLITALNMNKTFFLPPRFALLETANDAGAAMKLPGIEERLDLFASHILSTLSGRPPASQTP